LRKEHDSLDRIEDPVEIWLEGLLVKNTRDAYRLYIRKLMRLMKLNGHQLITQAKKDSGIFWLEAKRQGAKLTPTGRNMALNALRSFSRSMGIVLPASGLTKPPKKHLQDLEWDEAHRILKAAKSPYSWIFTLQLYCAWGIKEFLTFNTPETWENIRNQNGNLEYYKHDFPERKGNSQVYFSLVPNWILTAIQEARVPLPIRTDRGTRLDMGNYENAEAYIESAFRQARSRAHVTKLVGPHDLRDTFKSKGTTSGIMWEAKEFAMGHTIDRLYYDKCYFNLQWLWQELSKLPSIFPLDEK